MKRRNVMLIAGLVLLAAASFGVLPVVAQDETSETVSIQLTPADEGRCALHYTLLPPLLERTPGNAALGYYKAALLFEPVGEQGDQILEKMAQWQEMPLDDLPRDEIGAALKKYRAVLGELELAARRETCDWQLPLREQQTWSILLPELQKVRNMARMVGVKVRLAIAERRYDEAVHTLQTGYAMGRHVACGPTLVNGLVGIAICRVMSAQMFELIRQPDAPNLYWTLTALPRPMIDLRKAFEVEGAVLYLSYPRLQSIEGKDLTPAEWRSFLDEFFGELEAFDVLDDLRKLGTPEASAGVPRAAVAALGIKFYPAAKRYLIARGHTPEQVEAMPVVKTLVLYTLGTYDEYRDEMFKWFYVPYWQGNQGIERAEKELRGKGRRMEMLPLAQLLLPAVGSAKLAEARNDREIALLRTLEAIRIHAARTGKLPATLDAIEAVPLPIDPVTGKRFSYEVQDDQAVINVAKVEGRSAQPLEGRFEITLVGTKQ